MAEQCTAKVLVRDLHGNVTMRCELEADHVYEEHRVTMDGCEPVAMLRWHGSHEPPPKYTPEQARDIAEWEAQR